MKERAKSIKMSERNSSRLADKKFYALKRNKKRRKGLESRRKLNASVVEAGEIEQPIEAGLKI